MAGDEATSQEAGRMADLARNFCTLIEGIGEHRDPGWLRDVFQLLPQLHVAVVSLEENGDARASESEAALDERLHPGDDLDSRFELYTRVRSELGDHDGYWLEFDPVGDAHADMSGSLADDLVDIYHDVRRGLELLEAAPEGAAKVATRHWKRTYRLHWGQHLVDAERHLYALRARNRLQH
ncbi:MAG TPA: DUF5063 domain-containing protein [Gammaproteobacteria bacterium]